MLGRDDVDGLVGIHICEACGREDVRKTSADDLRAVKTEDGVYESACDISRCKLLRNRLCLGKTGFLLCDVDVVIDMAVACGKMSLAYSQEKIAFLCSDLIRICSRHNISPYVFFSVYNKTLKISRKILFSAFSEHNFNNFLVGFPHSLACDTADVGDGVFNALCDNSVTAVKL